MKDIKKQDVILMIVALIITMVLLFTIPTH